MKPFANRAEAGKLLADRLRSHLGSGAVVFGLPRGGVITARAVSDRLCLPLDVIIVRKIGHPGNPEYALGAVTDEGEVMLNEDDASGISSDWLESAIAQQIEEAIRRRELYIGGRSPVDVKGKTAIVVDDGIATGYTMRAAVSAIRKRGPSRVVVAAPIAAKDTVEELALSVDEVVTVELPSVLHAVGEWYRSFRPVEDEEVIHTLKARPRDSGAD